VVTVRFTSTRSEFGSCFRRVQTRRWRHWTNVGLSAAVAALGAATAATSLIIGGLLYGVVYAAIVWWLGPGVVWRRIPQLRCEQSVSVCDEGVRMQWSDASTTAAWSFWRSARLIDDIYVLQARQRSRCLVPGRAFDSRPDEQRFRDLLTAHLGARLPPRR
jgi:hypothetical protein